MPQPKRTRFPKAEAMLKKDLEAADKYAADLRIVIERQQADLKKADQECDVLRAELNALEVLP